MRGCFKPDLATDLLVKALGRFEGRCLRFFVQFLDVAMVAIANVQHNCRPAVLCCFVLCFALAKCSPISLVCPCCCFHMHIKVE